MRAVGLLYCPLSRSPSQHRHLIKLPHQIPNYRTKDPFTYSTTNDYERFYIVIYAKYFFCRNNDSNYVWADPALGPWGGGLYIDLKEPPVSVALSHVNYLRGSNGPLSLPLDPPVQPC